MTEIASTPELIQALKAAQAGETITLAPVVFDFMALTDLIVPDPGVTVLGAIDNRQRPTSTMRKMKLAGVQGVAFESVEFAPDPAEPQNSGAAIVRAQPLTKAGQVQPCRTIWLKGCVVHGEFMNSQGVSLNACEASGMDSCEVYDCYDCIANGKGLGNRFRYNHVHDARRDAFTITGGIDNLYELNLVHDFHHLGQSGVVDPDTGKEGDHSDAFQWWQGPKRLRFFANCVSQGMGAAMQGFFGNPGSGGERAEDLEVTGNIIIGGNWNGISVTGADRVNISGNYMLGPADKKPWIRAKDCTEVTRLGNVQLYTAEGDITVPAFIPEVWEIMTRMTAIGAGVGARRGERGAVPEGWRSWLQSSGLLAEG
jgi:hypothetical protein